MKKLLLIALAACLPFSMALAQNPANFHIVFGNVDGSALSVGIDKDIQVPVWASTDPTPGNPDSVTFLHVPLMSDDLIITARTGGTFPAYGLGLWDDRSFLTVNNHGNDPAIAVGFTSQSFLGFAYLTDPRDAQNFIYTLGAYQLLASYNMHTANNPALIGTTVNPFSMGHNPANQGLLWGMQDGIRNVVPTQVYGALYFSPNTAPVIDAPAAGTSIGGCNVLGTVVVNVTGHDIDTPPQPLTFTADNGGVFAGTQTGGTIAGTITFTQLGVYDAHIDLYDGVDHTTILIHVTNQSLTNANSFLKLDHCADAVAPGSDVTVGLSLVNVCPVGGFEILISTDPTQLTLTAVTPTARINNGSEYFNWVHDPIGAGSARMVWAYDIPNGVPGIPCAPGNGAIINLSYHVASGLPFDALIPINFTVDGPGDYTSNTISDETGNLFIHPGLDSGCVYIANPSFFRGDPNMNCYDYEIADAVLVAQRLIIGYSVWAGDDDMANIAPCTRHHAGNDAMQEAAGDLNGSGHPDIADLVRFINIINGFIIPKVDPAAGQASFFMNDGAVRISSNVEVGGVLVRIAHSGEIGTPVAANGMQLLSNDAGGVLSVVVYSETAKRIPVGNQPLFTLTGTGAITEASAADAYGEMMESRIGAPLPTSFAVAQNYPNPFNAQTLIKFALPNESDVTVNIYSVTGQLVETLKGHYAAGEQSIIWNASHVASGVYFAKVSVGSDSRTLRMTLLK